MISFRVTEEEYDSLQSFQAAAGSRSISDLTRLAVQRLLSEPPAGEGSVDARLAELEARIDTLGSELLRLSRQLSLHMSAS